MNTIPRLPTIDDVELREKKVLIRVDFNSPISRDGEILDDSRIKAHIPTLKKLLDLNNSIVILSLITKIIPIYRMLQILEICEKSHKCCINH